VSAYNLGPCSARVPTAAAAPAPRHVAERDRCRQDAETIREVWLRQIGGDPVLQARLGGAAIAGGEMRRAGFCREHATRLDAGEGLSVVGFLTVRRSG